MIRHIVMFKIASFDNEEDKIKKIEHIKTTYENLELKIKQIGTYEVGRNINTSSDAYDVIIISTFKSKEDLSAYLEHPEHLYVIEKLRNIPKEKKLVDFEVTKRKKQLRNISSK
jgi:hypothetical protein